ncbi:hypothetical protein [Streptomyces enissocaesilis]|uniref:Uncharacterized protein n=1 Tax=Streptomyces enissocaesilis TaxID=332589 RepID=A0ABP6JS80_9ACTN
MARGDKWYADPAGPPAHVRHDTCGHLATPLVTCDVRGDPLTVADTTQLPGPGGRTGPGTRLLGPLLTAGGKRDEHAEHPSTGEPGRPS